MSGPLQAAVLSAGPPGSCQPPEAGTAGESVCVSHDCHMTDMMWGRGLNIMMNGGSVGRARGEEAGRVVG